ncbi:cell envelope integrity protein CreD [Pseudomonas sp. SLFW]|uniref:cell envelope integrity protein CreD n=1 Tax=Pseudomonas sp. SLFW TaxID=2683259 RepID=UPI001411CD14|nr:cell envelope integrity protein CreD [Pseudomonas sp. SLFW]NBB10497.1 cell envelope integrity protein CreD [Pseudomonas sp. SLFW]
MNKGVSLYKLGMIGLLMLLLLIPLMMINGIIQDRQSRRNVVIHDIARSSSYSQQLTGPVLIVPYRRTVQASRRSEVTQQRYEEPVEERGRLYFLPDEFTLNGKVQTEVRARGIYEARLYHATNTIAGNFVLPERFGLGDEYKNYHFDEPFLAVGISDVRGIENDLKLNLDGKTFDFVPGTDVPLLGEGVRVMLPTENGAEKTTLKFTFDLRLQGTGQLQVTPVGKSSRVELSADWPHPSFIGNFLPSARNVSDTNFNATWETSFFSTNLQDILNRCPASKICTELTSRSFGVSFISPVDQYLKADRSIKYALLFIALTFACFLLFEVLKGLAVHPVQYALVGAALALFYLLLLSLSEHIGFGVAYLISATVCVALISFYVSHVLGSVAHGTGFGIGLGTLYALLYGLLSAEDYALLMGSLLLFGLLVVFMVLTRKLDWYAIAQRPAKPVVASSEVAQ